MNYGFVRVGACAPQVKVADIKYNASKIISMIREADENDIQIVAFPELGLCAYTCADLFHQDALVEGCMSELANILEQTKSIEVISILGMPICADNQLFNCAVVIKAGEVLGVIPKTYIPGYSEFYEERWFASEKQNISKSLNIFGVDVPFGTDILFEANNERSVCFGVEICEDLWSPTPPSSYQALGGALLTFNVSASNEVIGKYDYRKSIVSNQSARNISAYIYASAGTGESTTDLVYGGHTMIAEYGSILAEGERFSREDVLIHSDVDVDRLINYRHKNTSFMEAVYKKEYRKVKFSLKKVQVDKVSRFIDSSPFVPSNAGNRDKRCEEIFDIQTAGLAKRFEHTGLNKAVIGISGGLDSTLALLVTAKTFDILGIPRENIIAITMPGFGTTDMTYDNALELMKSMGVTIKEINIKDACLKHFEDIGHDREIHDVTYENVQARERTQVLMDLANKIGGLVIGTGDLSELALGWCTYNGDHMSMYAVNCSIPKTLVKFLVEWVADNIVKEDTKAVLHRIIDTPITPELLPPNSKGQIDQKTEDIIGPYELHDFFLYHMIRYGAPPKKILFLAKQAFDGKYKEEVIKKWLKIFYRRFFTQQFKRSCIPDGPKVGTISLSPRGDWRMPSDAAADIWLKELE